MKCPQCENNNADVRAHVTCLITYLSHKFLEDLEDLESTVLPGRARLTKSAKIRRTKQEPPMPLNLPAAALRLEITCELESIARLIQDQWHAVPAHLTPVGLALHVASWLNPLSNHEAASEIFTTLGNMCSQLRKAVDRKAQSKYRGPCKKCGQDLYTYNNDEGITCNSCHTHTTESELQTQAQAKAGHAWATATEIEAGSLVMFGETVTRQQLWRWVNQGRITAAGERKHRQYRLKDIMEHLNSEPT